MVSTYRVSCRERDILDVIWFVGDGQRTGRKIPLWWQPEVSAKTLYAAGEA
ncbi:protein of unknown function [Acidithiobacillus ferrivorans]|uniref:Uncharacterized protein n=1 Tax=Acidithiobacillus ferrivorans TaxID=160808 RepID=A0ABY1MUJ2_9PROT|nr:protein of unknown function [Acidithiobacillus ferrivorans]